MTLTVEHLLSIARRYWPSDKEKYLHPESSPEVARFYALWEEELQKMERWGSFVRALNRNLPGFTLGNVTAPVDACFRCAAYPEKDFERPGFRWVVVGCLSILAPVYTLYGVQYTYSDTKRIGHKVFFDFVGAHDVPAHAASEGTLITLALLTALFSPNRPRLLLLDDIDQSLHPQAQMEFMRQLKRLLENFPEVQLVATTHSPYILDELDPSEVRVFALRKDGSVACRSLSEHPQAEKMRGVLTSGQLWSLDPEWRWVLEER